MMLQPTKGQKYSSPIKSFLSDITVIYRVYKCTIYDVRVAKLPSNMYVLTRIILLSLLSFPNRLSKVSRVKKLVIVSLTFTPALFKFQNCLALPEHRTFHWSLTTHLEFDGRDYYTKYAYMSLSCGYIFLWKPILKT